MSPRIDTDYARANAKSLHEANGPLKKSAPFPGRLGGPRSAAAFEEFEGYWHPALATMTENIEVLGATLTSVADTCERRDAADAEAFGFGAPRAF